MGTEWVSSRTKLLSRSASMEIAEQVKKRMAGELVIDLSWGEPDFDTPPHIRKAAQAALQEGFTHYTSGSGIIELREAIAAKLAEDNGLRYCPETEIIVTPGCKQAIAYALLAFIDPGDEVLVPEPYWLSYRECVTLADGKLVPIPTTEEHAFKVRKGDLVGCITHRTKAIIVNSPANPTGAVYSRHDLQPIAESARENDLLVISDEVYEKIVFDGGAACSIASLNGMKERSLVVNGFSKAYAMTGWRIGYLAASEGIVAQILKVHQHVATCASSISQKAALEALRGPQNCVREMVREYEKRRDVLLNGLSAVDGISCSKPAGTFYALVNLKGLGLNSIEAAHFFLEQAGVATVPGVAYGQAGEGYVRVSFATSRDRIATATDRLAEAIGRM